MRVPRTTPVHVKAPWGAKTTEITWADGARCIYPNEILRGYCPCAHCQGEGGRPGELQMITVFRPEQIELEDLEMVGRYALAPLWKDGHHTGIYTWRNLREMCPDCTSS